MKTAEKKKVGKAKYLKEKMAEMPECPERTESFDARTVEIAWKLRNEYYAEKCKEDEWIIWIVYSVHTINYWLLIWENNRDDFVKQNKKCY